jgi:predicted acetyltransferase
MQIEIVPAQAEQEPIFANLLELYIHDFSELIDVKLGEDGRFGYADLSSYWSEPNRYPFIIKTDGQLAGFALVRRGSEMSDDSDVWDMTEFFVIRGVRRRGVGMKAAHAIWKQFPGKWEVRVIDRNEKALKFWGCAIKEFLGRAIEPTPFDKDGAGWHVFEFDAAPSRRATYELQFNA